MCRMYAADATQDNRHDNAGSSLYVACYLATGPSHARLKIRAKFHENKNKKINEKKNWEEKKNKTKKIIKIYWRDEDEEEKTMRDEAEF